MISLVTLINERQIGETSNVYALRELSENIRVCVLGEGCRAGLKIGNLLHLHVSGAGGDFKFKKLHHFLIS